MSYYKNNVVLRHVGTTTTLVMAVGFLMIYIVYVTAHEKTDHSLQNNFFYYEAIKSEEWPYLYTINESRFLSRAVGNMDLPTCKSEWSSRQATSD